MKWHIQNGNWLLKSFDGLGGAPVWVEANHPERSKEARSYGSQTLRDAAIRALQGAGWDVTAVEVEE